MMRHALLAIICFLSSFQRVAADTTKSTADDRALQELEQRVTEMKESVFKAKAELRELEEAVLRGKIAGSKALITFDNEAEGFFTLTAAEFVLDGESIYRVPAIDKAKPLKSARVFDNDLPAGDHTLEVRLTYQGSDKAMYAVFSYLKDHKFTLNNTEKFTVDYGRTTQLKLVALDKGRFKSDFAERLFLDVKTIPDWEAAPPE